MTVEGGFLRLWIETRHIPSSDKQVFLRLWLLIVFPVFQEVFPVKVATHNSLLCR